MIYVQRITTNVHLTRALLFKAHDNPQNAISYVFCEQNIMEKKRSLFYGPAGNFCYADTLLFYIFSQEQYKSLC